MTATAFDTDTYAGYEEASSGAVNDVEVAESHGDINPASTPSRPAASKSQATNRQKEKDRATRANIREGARKVIELQEAGAEVQGVVASIAGCENDLVELAVALSGPRANISGVMKDLESVVAEMEQDAMQAGIRIMGMVSDERKGLWNLLSATGADLPGRYPASDLKAATELAKAIRSLTDADHALLAKASELAG